MPGPEGCQEIADADPLAGRAVSVLVVDDEPDVRSSIADVLRLEGFTVAEAADGAAATWLIADGDFDVVVLDLSLCHTDGPEVLDALEPTATVVIVSAFSSFDETAIRDQFDSKIFGCLRKPASPLQLIEVVSAAAQAGRGSRVRPIAHRNAIRLGLAGLASLGPSAAQAADPLFS